MGEGAIQYGWCPSRGEMETQRHTGSREKTEVTGMLPQIKELQEAGRDAP